MKLKYVGAALMASGLFFAACSDSKETATTETEEITFTNIDTSTCDCQTDWFSNNRIVAPLEGTTSVFGGTSTINCDFHQWSWQKFLYLTQPAENQTSPYFLTEMTQVTSEMTTIPKQDGMIVLTEITQAGGNGLLTTNANLGSAETVYYSIHLDDTFMNAALEFGTMIKNQPDSVTNRQTFPVGALELKVSWVNTASMTVNQKQNYYTTMAVLDGTTTEVALLGMHVVGVVENHPEFVWATFEHEDLAPHYDWDATTSADVPVTSTTDMNLFAAGGSAGISNIVWQYGDTTKRYPNNVFSVYKYGTPKVPGGTFMKGTSQKNGTENYDNITHLTQSVYDTLNTRGMNSVWTNYFYDGSIWMNTDGLDRQAQITAMLNRSSNFGDVSDTLGPVRGSVAAANISMETYEQVSDTVDIHNTTSGELMNCLVCHGPSSYLPIAGTTNAKSALYISHTFMNYMNNTDPTKSVAELRKYRIQKFEELRKNN